MDEHMEKPPPPPDKSIYIHVVEQWKTMQKMWMEGKVADRILTRTESQLRTNENS